jgi:hypothetical protein
MTYWNPKDHSSYDNRLRAEEGQDRYASPDASTE